MKTRSFTVHDVQGTHVAGSEELSIGVKRFTGYHSQALRQTQLSPGVAALHVKLGSHTKTVLQTHSKQVTIKSVFRICGTSNMAFLSTIALGVSAAGHAKGSGTSLAAY